MNVLGVLTADFGLYYDLVRALKARNVPFLSLVEGDDVPSNVGAVLTSAPEAARITGVAAVAYAPERLHGTGGSGGARGGRTGVGGEAREGGNGRDTGRGTNASAAGTHTGTGLPGDPVDAEGVEAYANAHDAVDAALRILSGRREYRRVLVGVDPGERPGVAILGDGRVLSMTQVSSPEAVVATVAKGLAGLVTGTVTVRVGHGAATHRDRIINALLAAGHPVEEVDETSTSPATYKTSEERDAVAAKSIALAPGVTVTGPRQVVPPAGEIRDIQRKSRLASEGALTISRDLARAVAVGKLTLDEAVRRQRRKAAEDA